jgi:hypothetical protein
VTKHRLCAVSTEVSNIFSAPPRSIFELGQHNTDNALRSRKSHSVVYRETDPTEGRGTAAAAAAASQFVRFHCDSSLNSATIIIGEHVTRGMLAQSYRG